MTEERLVTAGAADSPVSDGGRGLKLAGTAAVEFSIGIRPSEMSGAD